MQRTVQAHRFLDRPSRRAAAIPRTHQGILRSRRTHGRRRARMRRHLHQRPPAGVPAFAVRPAHHDQHPRHSRACREMHAGLFARGSRERQESVGEMLHQRHHACRISAAARQDGRLQSECDNARRLHERHGALAHRPLRHLRHAAHACGKHRIVQAARHEIHAGAESAGREDALTTATTRRRNTPSR